MSSLNISDFRNQIILYRRTLFWGIIKSPNATSKFILLSHHTVQLASLSCSMKRYGKLSDAYRCSFRYKITCMRLLHRKLYRLMLASNQDIGVRSHYWNQYFIANDFLVRSRSTAIYDDTNNTETVVLFTK